MTADTQAWTKGPWVRKYHERVTTRDDTDGSKSIAHVYARTTPGEHEANIHLIAAAPTMYAKLEKMIAWLERCAAKSEASAKDTRFITLAEANATDAKNYRATIADIQMALKQARGESP